MDRRTLLASFGTTALGALAGCADFTSSQPPAGSLVFRNESDLPHEIGIRVTDVGDRPGDDPGTVEGDPIAPPDQRNLSAVTTVGPDEEETYETVFTESIWYAVQFTVDGELPGEGRGSTRFTPVPQGEEDGRYLIGRVNPGGTFGWQITSTPDLGSFDG